MATNGKGKGTDLGDMTPAGGGKRGGLVIALMISVILLLVVAFLWAQELQKTKSFQDDVLRKDDSVKNLTAERDQALKEVSRLRSAPSDAEDEVRKLQDQIKELTDQASFAERQRQDAADLLIEAQRENLDLKSAVAEMETRFRSLQEGGE